MVSPTTQQALSLSLSSSQQASAYPTGLSGESEVIAAISPTSGDGIRGFSAVVSNGIGTSGVQSFLLGSKYLKAAQELLDEVVNVGSANGGKDKATMKSRESTPRATIGGSHNSGGESSSSKQSAELSTAQRQELQVKKAKLASMLDEVNLIIFSFL